MKLSATTIDILKSFTAINPSILIKKDLIPPYVDLKGDTVIGVLSPTKKVLAFARLEETFEHDVAIFDSAKFLTALSMFKDAELDITETHAEIKSGESTLDFTFCSHEAIVSPPYEWPGKPEYKDGSFVLHQNHIAELAKASAVLGAPDITFEGDGTVVRVTATDAKNPSSHKYTAIIDDCDVEFKVSYKIDVLKLFPSNYTVSMVAGDPRKPLRFVSETMEFYLAPEK